jgi:hypothetical protein
MVNVVIREFLATIIIEKSVVKARRGRVRAQAEDGKRVTNFRLLKVIPRVL